MTKEQEEAIDVCERIIKNRKFNLCSKIDDDDIKAIKTVLNLIQQLQEENKQKDKIIDEITEEVQSHIGFENRLKRDNREPDAFNQGRFYVANNINNIFKRNHKK